MAESNLKGCAELCSCNFGMLPTRIGFTIYYRDDRTPCHLIQILHRAQIDGFEQAIKTLKAGLQDLGEEALKNRRQKNDIP